MNIIEILIFILGFSLAINGVKQLRHGYVSWYFTSVIAAWVLVVLPGGGLGLNRSPVDYNLTVIVGTIWLIMIVAIYCVFRKKSGSSSSGDRNVKT